MDDKTETYQVKTDEPTHGYTGPLKVSYGGAYTNVGQQFLNVAETYDKERPELADINGLHQTNGYGVSLLVAPLLTLTNSITCRDGRSQSKDMSSFRLLYSSFIPKMDRQRDRKALRRSSSLHLQPELEQKSSTIDRKQSQEDYLRVRCISVIQRTTLNQCRFQG